MRFIKVALLSFIFIFQLIMGVSLFIRSHIRISRAVNIKAPKDSVMLQIRDAARLKNWYPGMDSAELFYPEGVVKGVVLDNKDSLHPA